MRQNVEVYNDTIAPNVSGYNTSGSLPATGQAIMEFYSNDAQMLPRKPQIYGDQAEPAQLEGPIRLLSGRREEMQLTEPSSTCL